MGRIIIRTALAILLAGLLTLAVVAELRRSALMGWPVWAWYALTGVTSVVLSLTWIPAKPSRWPEVIGLKLKILGLQLSMRAIKTRTFRYLVLRPFALGILSRITWKAFSNPDELNANGTELGPSGIHAGA